MMFVPLMQSWCRSLYENHRYLLQNIDTIKYQTHHQQGCLAATAHTYIYIYICTDIRIYIHNNVYTQTYMIIYVYTYIIKEIYIYIYILSIHTYITLHYITLRYVTLRYVMLHYITLHYITNYWHYTRSPK